MNRAELYTQIQEYLAAHRGETGVPAKEPAISALMIDLKGSLPAGFPTDGGGWAYDCTIKRYAPIANNETCFAPLDDDDDDDLTEYTFEQPPAQWCLMLQSCMFDYLLAHFIDYNELAGAIQRIISASHIDGVVTLYGEEIDYRYHDLKNVVERANQSRRHWLRMAEEAGVSCSIPEFVPKSQEWKEILNAPSPYEI